MAEIIQLFCTFAHMKKKILLSIATLLGSFALMAQNSIMLENAEEELKVLQDTMFLAKSDNARFNANERFIERLENSLEMANSFRYPFSSLERISILTSADKRFRIFTWAVISSDGVYDNYGFVQAENEATGEYEVYRLQSKNEEIFAPEEQKLSDSCWFGAVYYELITTKHENITYYTLLGWDGKDIYSKRKVIEPITFKHNSGRPSFGAAIFYKQKGIKRMIFEYAPDVSFNLKYDDQFFEIGGIKKKKKRYGRNSNAFEVEDKKIEQNLMILYDELESKNDAILGFNQLNVPSGKVIGLVFERGRWRKVENLVPRNAKKKKEIDVNTYDFSKERKLY